MNLIDPYFHESDYTVENRKEKYKFHIEPSAATWA